MTRTYEFYRPVGDVEYLVKARVSGRYTPATGPTYACGGTPEEFPEVYLDLYPVINGAPVLSSPVDPDNIDPDLVYAWEATALDLEHDYQAAMLEDAMGASRD